MFFMSYFFFLCVLLMWRPFMYLILIITQFGSKKGPRFFFIGDFSDYAVMGFGQNALIREYREFCASMVLFVLSVASSGPQCR